MPLLPYGLARPFLFGLDPEAAHDLTLEILARLHATPFKLAWCNRFVPDPIELAGLRFPNRVGLAAGLDKNARCVDALGAMGFGFIEVGTVTPQPQPGSPKPRMFRLPQLPPRSSVGTAWQNVRQRSMGCSARSMRTSVSRSSDLKVPGANSMLGGPGSSLRWMPTVSQTPSTACEPVSGSPPPAGCRRLNQKRWSDSRSN